MKIKYLIDGIEKVKLNIVRPYVIFLKGDLGSGKTTFSKYIINSILGINEKVLSPTYTYYNKYNDVYHFDLYRLNNYDEFFAIGGEDIFDNNSGVIIVEWPEILESYYKPDLEIIFHKTTNDKERIIELRKT
ncbi:tRNA (adenosine(37)-N6)-threonylcarbamoyltransferase complex ATPase subunit type 1 TsaE [Candidatus Gracilibacteria bacterium]|nr:MAG: tRNA (adenosine(37)-N6)-threonylcarbamoyltransferase complex ATPase subunit type 1 TsaE [Candidatus Gracilibacteria bacterium]